MRKGYRREYDPDQDKEVLVDRKGETIAGTKYNGSHVYATVQSFLLNTKTKGVKDRDELRRLLATLSDKHYMMTTTGWQRCKDCIWSFFSNPVWGCCWADYSTDPPRLLVGLSSW